MPPPAFDARLTDARTLSPSVRSLTLTREDGAPFDFVPGQWVSLVLPGPAAEDGSPTELRRAYSIASPPDGSSTFELAVTRVDDGKGSLVLHALAVGASVRVIGPQGFFTRDAADPRPTLFVGTGTGVTPLRSMIRASAGRGVPMALLFGGRDEGDLLYRDELEALARKDPSLVVTQTLSRGTAAWSGRRGYVQLHAREMFESLAARSSAPPHVFVCGLEKMVGAVRALFRKELELPREQVHSERYD